MTPTAPDFNPSTITQPHERLLTYYFIVALFTLPAFPVTMIVLYIKYRTMRFRFDHEGIWKRQGLLWRHETTVAYRRIQDIHMTSGIIQRWLGLATVSIQTAAGSSTGEVTIEGVLEADALRDYLYTKDARCARRRPCRRACAGWLERGRNPRRDAGPSHRDSRLASPA